MFQVEPISKIIEQIRQEVFNSKWDMLRDREGQAVQVLHLREGRTAQGCGQIADNHDGRHRERSENAGRFLGGGGEIRDQGERGGCEVGGPVLLPLSFHRPNF